MSSTAGAQQHEPAHSVRAGEALAPSRVLLIEDEPGIVDFLRRGLTAEGFVVDASLDGTEGERLALGRATSTRSCST